MTTPAKPPTSNIGKLTALFPKDKSGNPKFITEPVEFNDTAERLDGSGLCNLLCAILWIDSIPAVQAISLRVIASRDDMWYSPSFGKGNLALKGEAIAILFREAGGSYLPSLRMDDRKDPLYWHIQGRVAIRGMNGLMIEFGKDRELDLRPGSPEIEGMRKDGQPQHERIAQARQTGLRVCETKAQLRAMRAALGLSQLYKPAAAKLPFVIPTLVPNPDMSNPQHVGFMLAHSMGKVEAIFGKGNALPAHVETEHGRVDTGTGEIIDGEVVDPAVVNAAAAGAGMDAFDDPEPDEHRCTCPCGCTAVVAAEAAEQTMKRRQVVRCAACYPAAAFDPERHRNIQTLGMVPDVTVQQAGQMKAEAARRAAAR